jgi:hypothetical protein
MKRFNIIFMICNLILLAVILFFHFENEARERRHFEQVKPVMMRYYAEFGLKLPYENPQNMYELLAPMKRLIEGLSK